MARWSEHVPARAGRPPLELVYSTRRRRTASARAEDGRVVVQLPAGITEAERDRMVARLVDRVTGADRARRAGGDAALEARAHDLADRYVDGVRPTSVTWSTRMRQRWGSCTPEQGTIRISAELQRFPDHVLDHVLIHELAHLLHPRHDAAFHAVVARHPDGERAKGFLAGVRFAQAQGSESSSDSSGSSDGID